MGMVTYNHDKISIPAKKSEHYTPSELRRVIAQFGFAISYPKGVSMRPLFWEDDHYVVITRLDGKPAIGDMLVFEHMRQEKTAYVMHRLVAIDEAQDTTIYVMRGDNCIGCERISEDDIIGKVAEVYCNGKCKLRHAVWKKHFTVRDSTYLLYTKLWMKSWKIRKPLYGMRCLLFRIIRRIL